ncbi:MAG: hypothetical protein G01um101466_335 [Parcubacteria group bacterium Gr01-1014_66]|nr:MAG: hypothetical protein G01um101466_335 [Parcubacteria group bacterium Gr01-1014_66]
MDKFDVDIEQLEKKIDALQHSIDALRRIFFWAVVITVILFVLPLVGLLFVIPQFLSVYSGILE